MIARMPPVRKPPEPAPIGVLLVHGIGDHKEGETLVDFGEPVMDWLRDWLRGSGERVARGSVQVTQARLRATRTEAVSPAYAEVLIERAGDAATPAQSERWLVAEAWWGDSVQPPRTLRLLVWLLTRGPLLIYWHFFLGPLRSTKLLSQKQLALSLVAFILCGLLQIVVLVAMLLWLIPFGPWRRAVASAVRTLTLTLGDSFVLLEQDFQSAALVRRVERALDWLGERATKLIVVAHSQGGAIAHEALRRHTSGRVAAFISVGSGLEKLHFLRHVRDKRGGLAAATLLGVLVGATVALFALGLSAPERRWVAGLGGLVGIGSVFAFALLLNALEAYRGDLRKRIADLDLRPALGSVEWHDLHATNDVVPMGEGSLFNGLGFIVRDDVVNQRSYLGDHIAYFENRLGFLPLLWRLLARHSKLALFSAPDLEQLARATRRHARHAWALWFSGATNWVALFAAMYALRDSLGPFGSSALGALEGVGLGALAKPVRLAGGVLDGFARRAGLIDAPSTPPAPGADAGVLAAPLFGVLVVVTALIVWWALFRAAWLARAGADWRGVCRTPARPESGGQRAWDIATLALWGAFGSMSLLVVLLFANNPDASTWQLLTQSIAAVVSALVLALAALYAIGSAWAMDDDEERLWLPPGALFMAGILVLGARWLWPAGFVEATIDALISGLWIAMGLSWLVWLGWRGTAIYGFVGVLGIVVATALLGTLASRIEVSALRAIDPVLVADGALIVVLTAIESVRSHQLLIGILRATWPLSLHWPVKPTA